MERLPRLSDFPQGLRVRHQALINGRVISTLYGAIKNGSIETSGLQGSPQKFRNPVEFAQAHKNSKIRSEKFRSIRTHNWNIIDYWDTKANTWKKLNDYFGKTSKLYSGDTEMPTEMPTETESRLSITTETEFSEAEAEAEADTDSCDNIKLDFQQSEDDNMSFVSCISVETDNQNNLDYTETIETISDQSSEILDPYQGLPYRYTWKRIDTIEVWEWSLWATPEFAESIWRNYFELCQDDINLSEIEDELAYQELDREYPWITRHNLPHEEELWIATVTNIPVFGEVWMDAFGNSWEMDQRNGCLSEVGLWIGKWSWDNRIMDLGATPPSPLLDDEEFWDVLQDFEEIV